MPPKRPVQIKAKRSTRRRNATRSKRRKNGPALLAFKTRTHRETVSTGLSTKYSPAKHKYRRLGVFPNVLLSNTTHVWIRKGRRQDDWNHVSAVLHKMGYTVKKRKLVRNGLDKSYFEVFKEIGHTKRRIKGAELEKLVRRIPALDAPVTNRKKR